MTSQLDLHFYDNKIKCDEIIALDIIRISAINQDEKMEAFSKLRSCIPKNSIELVSIDNIIETYKKFGRNKNVSISETVIVNQNYDPTNNLFACDLLYLCYEKICLLDDKGLLNSLITQLIDMSTGICPAGKTIRLYQILSAHLD